MKKTFLLFLCLLLLSACSVAYAHPGKTDGSGGHYDRQNGGYHYHHGYSAHQHEDLDGDGVLDCPYNFVDKTDHSNKGSSNNYGSKDSESFTPMEVEPSAKSNPAGKFSFFGILFFIIILPLIFFSSIFPIIQIVIFFVKDYIVLPIINFFKRRRQQKIDRNKNVAVAVYEEPEEENSQFYTGSRKIKKALTKISVKNLSSAEKAIIDDYFLNIRCMEKRIKKLSEIGKNRTLLNDSHFEQDDYESHLKIISIYENIILKEEEKIVPIIMKQPIS